MKSLAADHAERARTRQLVGDQPELKALAGLGVGADLAHGEILGRAVDGQDEGGTAALALQQRDILRTTAVSGAGVFTSTVWMRGAGRKPPGSASGWKI